MFWEIVCVLLYPIIGILVTAALLCLEDRKMSSLDMPALAVIMIWPLVLLIGIIINANMWVIKLTEAIASVCGKAKRKVWKPL